MRQIPGLLLCLLLSGVAYAQSNPPITVRDGVTQKSQPSVLVFPSGSLSITGGIVTISLTTSSTAQLAAPATLVSPFTPGSISPTINFGNSGLWNIYVTTGALGNRFELFLGGSHATFLDNPFEVNYIAG